MGNICFVNTTKSWGGGENWHFEATKHLSLKNPDTLIVTILNSELDKKVKTSRLKVENITIGNLSFLNILKLIRLAIIFKNNNISTVVINSSEDMKAAGLAAKFARVKNIIYRRGSAIPIKNKLINRLYFKHVITNVLANSKETKKTINFHNKKLFPKNKITVIPNGLKTKEFLNSEFEPYYISKNEEFVIGNLGRMVEQKNQLFLLKVLKNLIEKGHNTKLIIGGTGKLEQQIKNEALKLQIQDSVIFIGFVENPKNLMMSLDVFLLPSLWEGFGYVIAEAMLCKKPVIAFNTSSNPEIIDNNVTGYLTAINSVEETTNFIEMFIKKKELIDEMGVKGQKKIINEFDLHLVLNKIEQYLNGINN